MTRTVAVILAVLCTLVLSCEMQGPEPEPRLSKRYIARGHENYEAPAAPQDALDVCSFNIAWLGHLTKKDNESLAAILEDYDVVVVQELVAPPRDGIYPDGTAYEADKEAAAFCGEMVSVGFDYVLSEEDTGDTPEIHKAGTATEWWIAFYKSGTLGVVEDLPHGFLAEDRSAHGTYVRVPYAFAFRTQDGTVDFVLVSVHLESGTRDADAEVRKRELTAIAEWIDDNDDVEKDFIILGDMNIEDGDELLDSVPAGFVSMNSECWPTNTNPNSPMPYDHVMYRPEYTSDQINEGYGMWIVDLLASMEATWDTDSLGPYPGDTLNYSASEFREYYSDHNPIEFRMVSTGDDD